MSNDVLDRDVFIEFKERVVEQLTELTKETKNLNAKVDTLNSKVSEIKVDMEKFAHKDDLKKIEDALYRLARKEEIDKINERIGEFVTQEEFDGCKKDEKENKKFTITNWMVLLAAVICASAAIWAAILK